MPLDTYVAVMELVLLAVVLVFAFLTRSTETR
jgi:hypothetical protein